MDSLNFQDFAASLRQAAELLADGQMDGVKRREILKVLEPLRTALLGMAFDEGASRRKVVSFMRSVTLANGVIGKRTAHRLAVRTFEEDGEAAMKWLLERRLLEDQGSEGFFLTVEGVQYLDEHKGEFLPSAPEPRHRRSHAPRARASRPAEAPAEPAQPEPEAST